MSMLKKAASKAATNETTKKKERTVWRLPADSALVPVIQQFLQFDREKKAAEAKMDLPKSQLREHGRGLYVNDYVAKDQAPPTPMLIQCPDGQGVTYVVQDRTSQNEVTEQTMTMLTAILGEDKAQSIVFTDTRYSFDPELLGREAVANAVDKALTACVKKLRTDGELTEVEAEALLQATIKRRFRPRTIGNLTEICGKDTTKVMELLEAMGSAVVHYVQA